MYTPMFIIALFAIAEILKQPKRPSIDKWIKQLHTHTHTHTHMVEYYPSIKKDEILPFATT